MGEEEKSGFEKQLNTGEVLFKDGDRGDEMYLIKSGKIRISKSAGEVEKTLAVLKEGDFFGEMSVIDGSPRSATATAIEPAELVIFDREVFMNQVRENPLIEYVLHTLIRRLRDADEQIKFLLIKNEEKRLIAMLLTKAREGTQTDKGILIDFSFSYENLADLVGTTIEKTKSIVDNLLKTNLIIIKSDKIYVDNQRSLEEYLSYITLKEKFGGGD
ncbi:MAG: Crp/Fnr family transcriptional regulator [Candidatus Cloacimonadota bacterium]|nr:MAG: Crp/Fnr family transcriptional regulator [Candidatus Cloacimonadota bacterium]